MPTENTMVFSSTIYTHNTSDIHVWVFSHTDPFSHISWVSCNSIQFNQNYHRPDRLRAQPHNAAPTSDAHRK